MALCYSFQEQSFDIERLRNESFGFKLWVAMDEQDLQRERI